MKLLLRKLMRDIWGSLGQFVSLVMVLAVGCMFFTGMNEAIRSIEKGVDGYYEDYNLADFTGVFAAATDKAVDDVKNSAGVKSAAGRYIQNTFMKRAGKNAKTDATVISLTEGINSPRIVKGRMPLHAGECLVDSTYASAAGLKLNDRISVFMQTVKSVSLSTVDGSLNLTAENMSEEYSIEYSSESDADAVFAEYSVSGFFTSPEYVYKLNPSDVSSAQDEFAVILAPYESITVIDGLKVYLNRLPAPVFTIERKGNIFNQIVALTRTEEDAAALMETFSHPYIDTVEMEAAVFIKDLSYLKEDGPSEKAFRSAVDQVDRLVLILPTIFFAVAAVITFISLSKTVDNQRNQIGIMQAVGIPKGGIYFLFIFYALLAGLFGSLIGGFAGMYLFPYIYHLVFEAQFIMPAFMTRVSGIYLICGAAISLCVGALAAFLSCHRTLKEVPASALRPKKAKKVKPIFIEKITPIWKRLGFSWKMFFRNIFQNKLRILLSSMGVIGSVMLLITGFGLKDRVNYAVEYYGDSVGCDLMISSDAVFLGAEEVVSLSEGIERAELRPVMNVTVSHGKKVSDSMQLQGLKSGTSMVKLYSEYGYRGRIEIGGDSLILPHFLAEELGVETGDEIKLSVSGYASKNATVTGVAYMYLLPSVYAGEEIFDLMGVPESSDTAFITVKSGSDIASVKSELASAEGIKTVRTAAELKHRALSTANILDMAVVIIVLGAAVLAVTVIYNITSINIFERSREIATLMVLGCGRWETTRSLYGENVVVTLLGCLLGVPLGYGLFIIISGVVSSMNVSIPLNLTFPVVAFSILLAFVFSLAATFILTRRILKIDMVEALKSVE